MVHDARPSRGSRAATPPRLAIRVVPARRVPALTRRSPRQHLLLPVIGPNDVILPTFDQSLGDFALRAQAGDLEARDALYIAFLPKLQKMLGSVRPPFAPNGAEGMWNRDDIDQEGYLAFVELVDLWTGETSFTAYLLSRFQYRVRDAIQRGIARPSIPPRQVAVPLREAMEVPAPYAQMPEVRPLFDDLLAELEPHLAHVVSRKVRDGASITQIARELGVNRRTVSRYWAQARARSEDVLSLIHI